MMNGIFSVMLRPCRGFDAWWGLLIVSIASSVLLLLIFRAVSDKAGIRRSRNRTIARVLEMLLFKDDVVVNLGALGRVLLSNFVYLGFLLKPMLFSVIPFALILIQVSVWFRSRPLLPGETAVLQVKLAGASGVVQPDIAVSTSAGVEIETQAVRIPFRNEIAWRLVARSDGPQWADVSIESRRERKEVVVGKGLAAVSNLRVRAGFLRELIHPGEKPLITDSPIEWIAVTHPDSMFSVFGMKLHWLVVYFAMTLLIAWALKRPLGVEI